MKGFWAHKIEQMLDSADERRGRRRHFRRRYR